MKVGLETNRLILCEPSLDSIDEIQEYLISTKFFLKEWEPLREASYYEKGNIKERILSELKDQEERKYLGFYLKVKKTTEIIGTVSLSNIIYGSFLSCYLGYKLCEKYQGKGYMTEAILEVVRRAFFDYKLHRIEANIMPKNNRSIKVIEKCGFINEGISKEYLKINGKWEDHYHYVKLNEEL